MNLKHHIDRNGILATVTITTFASLRNVGSDGEVQYRVGVMRGPEPPRSGYQVPYAGESIAPHDTWTGCYHEAVMHYAKCVLALNMEAAYYSTLACATAESFAPSLFDTVNAALATPKPVIEKPKRKYTRRVKTTTSTPAAKSAKKEKK